MSDTNRDALVPEAIRQLLTLALTVIAAVLYAMILGRAVVRTVLDASDDFTPTEVRAASLLSGLVGTVVTAGFARSKRRVPVQVSRSHALGDDSASVWHSLKPPSLAKRNLLSLAEALGVSPRATSLSRTADGSAIDLPKQAAMAMWIALVYVAIYFLVGISAFIVSLWIEQAPGMVTQAGWVWLGTTVSAAYSFFGLSVSE